MSARARVGLALATGLLLGACDGIVNPDRPDEVRVLVEGEVAEGVQVITSHDFLVGGPSAEPGSDVQFLQADTAVTILPFDHTYDLGPTYIFAVRVLMLPGDSADVRLRVFLDGRNVWDERSVIADERLIQFYIVRQS